MKLFTVFALMMFSIHAFADVTEVVRWKPKAGATHAQVVEAVKKLKQMSNNVPGLVSKKTYYDSSANAWIDIVVWRDKASSDAFDAAQEPTPELDAIGKVIDFESMVTSDYSEIE